MAAAGAIAGAAQGVQEAIIAAVTQQDERKRANKAADLQRELNYQQLAYQRELRGEGGSPVVFPRYGVDQEQAAFQDAIAAYEGTKRLPGQAQAAYENIRSSTLPFMSRTVDAIGSGAVGEARLAEHEPVAQARLSAARTPAAAWARTIQERINKARARATQGGFSSTGGLLQRQFAGIEQDVRQQEGEAVSRATLQNAIEQARIQEQSRAEQIRTGLSAGDIASTLAALEQIPSRGVSDEFLQRLRVFSPFFVKQSFDPLATEYREPIGHLSAPAAVMSSLSGSGSEVVPLILQAIEEGAFSGNGSVDTGERFDYGGELN